MVTKARSGHGEAIRAIKPGEFATLERRLDQGGALQARRLKAGAIQFYWRYSLDGKTHREPIGVYDSSAPPKKLEPTAKGYSVAAALEACRRLAEKHSANALAGGLREVKAAEAKAYVERKAAEGDSQSKTLEALLGAYVAHLKAQKRRSFYDADQIFRLHVIGPWPKVAGKSAADVTPDEILDMLRRLIEAGKGRSANKLRSYVRAAYQCAIDVRTTASIPVAFKAFGVVFNPAAQTKRDSQFDRADKHPLSVNELRAYWKRIKGLPGVSGASLRLHLLSGGQRIEQIVRLRRADVQDDALTIFDAKGRPGHGARPHLLPLIAPLAATLQDMNGVGEFVVSTTDGKKHISPTTLGNWAREAVGTSIEGFQLKRIRSGRRDGSRGKRDQP